jgi:hypothetical protein
VKKAIQKLHESPRHDMIDGPIERFDGGQAPIAKAKYRDAILIDAADGYGSVVAVDERPSAVCENPAR